MASRMGRLDAMPGYSSERILWSARTNSQGLIKTYSKKAAGIFGMMQVICLVMLTASCAGVTSQKSSLALQATALSITTSNLPAAQEGASYEASLAALGGTPSYTWKVSSGSLPTGLTLASTGAISGTPTQTGAFSFTASVVDSASHAAQQPLKIWVVDQYGGRTDIKCAQATGWFHTEKINSRWWLCTPLGNVFYSLGTENAPGYIHGTFGPADVNRRMQSWGFNTVTIQAHVDDYPTTIDSFFPLDSMGLHTNPVKMPFIASIRAAYYAMRNPAIGAAPLLTNPVKDMIFSHSSFDTNFVPSGIADYYDSGIGTWLTADLASSSDFWAAMATSPDVNYMMGIGSDDGDQMNGFGAGPDFATTPAGHNNANLALRVAAMSPLQTAASNVANGVSYVYADTLIHTKKALQDSLATEYGTVAAPNAAWGSGYTTFDSSGTCVGSQPITCASTVSADSVGTGNGSTLTFSTTLSHTTISAFSLQILVAGTPVAGDLGPGGGTTSTFYGPNVSTSSINYSTGAISITFTAGNAPANGAALTATYVANGWGIRTGFLDEDNPTAHNSYLGTDWIALSNAGATVQTDLTAFLKSMAAQYFSTCRTQLKAVFPNNMYLGPDSLDSWNGPSAAPVLQAAGQYIDLFITSDSQTFSQAMLDYIATNYGDKPFLGSFYSVPNPNSAMAAFPSHMPC